MSYQFSCATNIVTYNGKAVLYNQRNGRWLRTTMETLDILTDIINSRQEISDIKFADEQDKQYIEKLLQGLEDRKLIVDSNEIKTDEFDTIYYEITHRCNLQCIHCCANASTTLEEYFTTEEILSNLDKIIEASPKMIVLSGGEPLVRNDFVQVANYLRDHFSGHLCLMTNGLLINERNVALIKNTFNSISVSLDGADEESCSAVRGKGVFMRAVNAIKLLQNAGVQQISTSMVIMQNNFMLTQKYFALNKELGTTPMMRLFLNSGRGKENESCLSVDMDNFDPSRTIDNIDHKQGATSNSSSGSKSSVPHILASTCQAGFHELTIAPNGDIRPCNLLDEPHFILGNISENGSLHTILAKRQNESVYANIRKIRPEGDNECALCPVRMFCWTCPFYYYKNQSKRSAIEKRCKYTKPFYLKYVWGE